jgi:hypothetical protein
MVRAVIACGWMGDGLTPRTGHNPILKLHFPTGIEYKQIIGNPASSPCAATIVCSETTLDEIRSHVGYTIVSSQTEPV